MSKDLVSVYVGNFTEAGFLQNLLEQHGIQAQLENEAVGSLFPGALSREAGVPGVTIVVAQQQQQDAEQLIKDFMENSKDETLEVTEQKRLEQEQDMDQPVVSSWKIFLITISVISTATFFYFFYHAFLEFTTIKIPQLFMLLLLSLFSTLACVIPVCYLGLAIYKIFTYQSDDHDDVEENAS